MATKATKQTTLGERLRARRTSIGMTQTRLAAIIGVHPRDLIRYEADDVVPRIDRVRDLAVALDIDPAELAGWTSSK